MKFPMEIFIVNNTSTYNLLKLIRNLRQGKQIEIEDNIQGDFNTFKKRKKFKKNHTRGQK